MHSAVTCQRRARGAQARQPVTMAVHRVALLISADSWRGSGVSFALIARGLAECGHTPLLLTVAAPLTERFRAEGLPVTELPLRRTGAHEVRLLRGVLRAARPAVLIADMPRDLRLGSLATLGLPTQLVYRYNRSLPPARDIAVRLAYRLRVRETVFLTSGGRESVLADAPFMRGVPTRVIHEGFDTDVFRPDHAAADAYRGVRRVSGPLLLAVASLTREKRYDVLFRAVASIPAPRPPLHVCGEGPLRADLERMAAELRLTVTFVGQLAPAELRGAYNAATVFVHACIGETFGRSIAEAMACGRPVVVPGAGAAPEVTGRDGVAGVVVPPLDPVAAATALSALLADPLRRERIGAAARKRSLASFSLAAMTAGYDLLVRELADPR